MRPEHCAFAFQVYLFVFGHDSCRPTACLWDLHKNIQCLNVVMLLLLLWKDFQILLLESVFEMQTHTQREGDHFIQWACRDVTEKAEAITTNYDSLPFLLCDSQWNLVCSNLDFAAGKHLDGSLTKTHTQFSLSFSRLFNNVLYNLFKECSHAGESVIRDWEFVTISLFNSCLIATLSLPLPRSWLFPQVWNVNAHFTHFTVNF